MSNDPRVLVLLELERQTALLRQILAALTPKAEQISDRLLDGQYGDPIVKTKDPRDWTGDSMKGMRFSQCPPDYLDLFAERAEFFVEQNTAKRNDAADQDELTKIDKDIKYGKLDAQRARGWAARLRAGWKPAEPQTTSAGEPTW